MGPHMLNNMATDGGSTLRLTDADGEIWSVLQNGFLASQQASIWLCLLSLWVLPLFLLVLFTTATSPGRLISLGSPSEFSIFYDDVVPSFCQLRLAVCLLLLWGQVLMAINKPLKSPILLPAWSEGESHKRTTGDALSWTHSSWLWWIVCYLGPSYETIWDSMTIFFNSFIPSSSVCQRNPGFLFLSAWARISPGI